MRAERQLQRVYSLGVKEFRFESSRWSKVCLSHNFLCFLVALRARIVFALSVAVGIGISKETS